MKIAVIIVCFSSFLLAQELYVDLFSGYNSNFYKQSDTQKSITPYGVHAKSSLGYAITTQHRPSLAFGSRGLAFLGMEGDEKNKITYFFKPQYFYNSNKGVKITFSYLYEFGLDDNDFMYNKPFHTYVNKGLALKALLNSSSDNYVLSISVQNNKKSEKNDELSYLDNDKLTTIVQFAVKLFPETKINFPVEYKYLDYTNKIFADIDYKYFTTGAQLLSKMSSKIYLDIKVFESYIKYINGEKFFDTNFRLLIETKASEIFTFKTIFAWLNEEHRSIDAYKIRKKTLSFLTDYIFNPWSFSGKLSYSLLGFSKPNIRNELELNLNFQAARQFNRNSQIYSSYAYRIHEADSSGVDIFGDTKVNTYNEHRIWVGLKYEYSKK